MIPVPTRFQASMPPGRWAPMVGVYPPAPMSTAPTGTVADLMLPPVAAPAPVPLPGPVVMPSAAEGMRPAPDGQNTAESGGDDGRAPSVPSPNQDLASVVDTLMTGVGMILGGPVAMMAALPAMAALSQRSNPQPTLGVLGAIGQLMGYPTVGQMVQGWLGGGSWGGDVGQQFAGNLAELAGRNDDLGRIAADILGAPIGASVAYGGNSGGDFSGISSEAGALAGSSTDSFGNPII